MKRALTTAAIAVVALATAVVVYQALNRVDAPDAFELSDDAGQPEEADSATGSAPESESADPETGELVVDGTWVVGAGSEAGYRVVEDLKGIIDFEAVGRTDQVTGTIEIVGATITSASFDVDIASMDSDDGTRDGQFRGPIMNARTFPTATLTLTEPIVLEQPPSAGASVSAIGIGQLTLRGETNPVEIPIEAQLSDRQIEIVASVDVLFSDYGIDNPSNRFVSVRDEGKVEVLLLLDKG